MVVRQFVATTVEEVLERAMAGCKASSARGLTTGDTATGASSTMGALHAPPDDLAPPTGVVVEARAAAQAAQIKAARASTEAAVARATLEGLTQLLEESQREALAAKSSLHSNRLQMQLEHRRQAQREAASLRQSRTQAEARLLATSLATGVLLQATLAATKVMHRRRRQQRRRGLSTSAKSPVTVVGMSAGGKPHAGVDAGAGAGDTVGAAGDGSMDEAVIAMTTRAEDEADEEEEDEESVLDTLTPSLGSVMRDASNAVEGGDMETLEARRSSAAVAAAVTHPDMWVSPADRETAACACTPREFGSVRSWQNPTVGDVSTSSERGSKRKRKWTKHTLCVVAGVLFVRKKPLFGRARVVATVDLTDARAALLEAHHCRGAPKPYVVQLLAAVPARVEHWFVAPSSEEAVELADTLTRNAAFHVLWLRAEAAAADAAAKLAAPEASPVVAEEAAGTVAPGGVVGVVSASPRGAGSDGNSMGGGDADSDDGGGGGGGGRAGSVGDSGVEDDDDGSEEGFFSEDVLHGDAAPVPVGVVDATPTSVINTHHRQPPADVPVDTVSSQDTYDADAESTSPGLSSVLSRMRNQLARSRQQRTDSTSASPNQRAANPEAKATAPRTAPSTTMMTTPTTATPVRLSSLPPPASPAQPSESNPTAPAPTSPAQSSPSASSTPATRPGSVPGAAGLDEDGTLTPRTRARRQSLWSRFRAASSGSASSLLGDKKSAKGSGGGGGGGSADDAGGGAADASVVASSASASASPGTVRSRRKTHSTSFAASPPSASAPAPFSAEASPGRGGGGGGGSEGGEAGASDAASSSQDELDVGVFSDTDSDGGSEAESSNLRSLQPVSTSSSPSPSPSPPPPVVIRGRRTSLSAFSSRGLVEDVGKAQVLVADDDRGGKDDSSSDDDSLSDVIAIDDDSSDEESEP